MLEFNAKKQLLQFLSEDIGKGDITSQLLPKKNITGRIITRQTAIVAGARHAKEIFRLNGCNDNDFKKRRK